MATRVRTRFAGYSTSTTPRSSPHWPRTDSVFLEDSHSNYMYTELTMASLLQMRHIADIPGIEAERDLRLAINHNPTFDALRRYGYVVAATASGWETEAMRSADVFCGGETMDDFELNLFGPTVLGRLIELAAPRFIADRDRISIDTALDCISRVASVRADQPKFLYAHVPAPHLPIVFDRNGGPASPELYGHTAQELPVTAEQFQKGYTAGLEYLNRRVITAIDDIKSDASSPPSSSCFPTMDQSRISTGGTLCSRTWKSASAISLRRQPLVPQGYMGITRPPSTSFLCCSTTTSTLVFRCSRRVGSSQPCRSV